MAAKSHSLGIGYVNTTAMSHSHGIGYATVTLDGDEGCLFGYLFRWRGYGVVCAYSSPTRARSVNKIDTRTNNIGCQFRLKSRVKARGSGMFIVNL